MHQLSTLVLNYYYLIGILRGHRYLLKLFSYLYDTLVLLLLRFSGETSWNCRPIEFTPMNSWDCYDPSVLVLLRFLLSKKNPEPVTLCHYHMTWPSVFSALNWGALLTKLWIPTLHTRLPDITVCWKLLQLTKNVCFFFDLRSLIFLKAALNSLN